MNISKWVHKTDYSDNEIGDIETHVYKTVIYRFKMIYFWGYIHKTCWDQIMPQVFILSLKSETSKEEAQETNKKMTKF